MMYMHSTESDKEKTFEENDPTPDLDRASPRARSERSLTPSPGGKKVTVKPSDDVRDRKGAIFDKLSQEMTVFVASDTLNSLLVASATNITAETLILVKT